MRRLALVLAVPVAALCAACDSRPPDWNSLIGARIRDQLPAARVQPVDDKTIEASLGGKTLRVDTAGIALQCNRGPRDCDRAIDEVLLELGGPAAK